MKNFKFIIFAALLLFSVSCDKKLDLDPHQDINEDVALSTDNLVKLALAGAYDNLSQEGVYGGNLFRDAELIANDGEISWVGTFGDPREIFNQSMLKTNFDAENTWVQAYAAINACNNVLGALAVVNADDKARVEGEARFIRAACYFELARLFSNPDPAKNNGLGVPIVTEPTRRIDATTFVRRNTAAEVYQFVHDELHAAIGLLPEENDVYASKFAAMALVARLHLMLGEWDEASEFAGEVIDSDLFELESSYDDVWNLDDNSSEYIFAMQVSNQDGDNELVTFYSIPTYGGRDGDIEINQKHLDLYDADDARLSLFYDGNGATRTGKWRDQYKNIPIFRLAEMYLIRAEAAVRSGQNGDADFNKVHERAGLPAKTGVTLDDILLERRLELAFEGQRIHDVKRLKGTVNGLAWNADKLVFPIPQRDVDVNKNLVQNAGY